MYSLGLVTVTSMNDVPRGRPKRKIGRDMLSMVKMVTRSWQLKESDKPKYLPSQRVLQAKRVSCMLSTAAHTQKMSQ